MNILQSQIFKIKCESLIKFAKLCTKTGLKNAMSVDSSKFSRKVDLASFKSDVDK